MVEVHKLEFKLEQSPRRIAFLSVWTQNMRALVCHRCGDYLDLTVEDLVIPELDDNGVRTGVEYANVSFSIGVWGVSNHQVKPRRPFVGGAEVFSRVRERTPGSSSVACR